MLDSILYTVSANGFKIMNFINQAFEEALLAIGVSYPNPAVGAIVVKDGRIVGKGHTQVVHGPHAEVMALRDAGEAAKGATLYVTLEPCCHYGRTPPCTSAIIAAGIERVYFAHRDPNPLVFGKSEKILAEAGIVSTYVEPSPEFSRYFEAYDYFVKTKSPFVECKMAESADGFIAREDRSPVRSTADMANAWTAKWRRMAEFILVGGGTALADNPHLTVRGVSGHSPCRAVFCGSQVLPSTLSLFDDSQKKTLVFSRNPQPHLEGIAEVHLLPSQDFTENWKCVLDTFASLGVHRLAVETGATLAQGILSSGLWNRFYILRSAKTLGTGLPWKTGKEPKFQKIENLGEDTLWTALNPIP